MIASGRTALASSGRISGYGFASARMIGVGAIVATIAGVRMPPADSPRKMSAPSTICASSRWSVCRA